MKTPDLKPKRMNLELEYVNKLLGTTFNERDVKKLLEKMRFGVEIKGKKFLVDVPPYRADILHPIDLVEDIAIAYGYEKFQPTMPKLDTIGGADETEKFSDKLRELMLGFGFQDVMTMVMTNRETLFSRMNLREQGVVETQDSKSSEYGVARNWLLPSLMLILEKNKNKEYPQKLFEVGECVTLKGKNSLKMAAVFADSKSDFSGMKAIVSGLFESLNLELQFKPVQHGSFIQGRCAGNEFGFFGELHPKVLENFGVEVPVTALEFDADLILNKLR